MKYRYLLAGLILLAGCTLNFEEFNTNPNEATEEQLDWDNARSGSNFLQMEENVLVIAQSSASIGTDRYQTVEVMGGDAFVGYWGSSNANHNSAGRYNWNQASWYGDMFTTNYSRTMNAWRMLKLAIDDEEDPRYQLSQIVKVAAMHRVTDTYGPIPYISFGVEDEVPYDSQEDVYYKFFEELTEAADVLYQYAISGESVFSDYDCVYGGDIAQWVKFANSLRLRLAMHLAYVDPKKAQAEAEAAVADPGGLMTSASDLAELQHISPIESYESPIYIIAGWGDIRLGATLQSYMVGYDDPRLATWFYECSDGGYVGIRSGLSADITKSDYAPEDGYVTSCKFSIPVATSTSNVVWMKASETYFLLAEAALRGWDVGGTAQEWYEEGVTMSFSEEGVSGIESYLADDISVPSDFTDPVTSAYSANALGTITIAWNDSDDFETSLERIITQKYIALFPVGQEAWTEFRRTGYPKVFPVCVNESNGGCVDTDIQIRRLAFPEDEYNTNLTALQAGIALLGGADNPGTRLWWDAKE